MSRSLISVVHIFEGCNDNFLDSLSILLHEVLCPLCFHVLCSALQVLCNLPQPMPSLHHPTRSRHKHLLQVSTDLHLPPKPSACCR